MKKSRKALVLLMGTMMALSAAGCGSKSDPAPAETTTAGTVAEKTTEAGKETEEGKGYVIGFSNSYNGNSDRQAMEILAGFPC